MKKLFTVGLLCSALSFSTRLVGQTPVLPVDARPPRLPATTAGGAQSSAPADNVPSDSSSNTSVPGSAEISPDYVLGPGDVLTMSDIDLEEILAEKSFRIDNSGDVTLPLVGRVHAAGLTMSGLEAEVNRSMAKFLKDPAVVIGVTEFHSQPVSVLGAVNNPGVHQLRGSSNLYTVLSLAGGLRLDSGRTIQITRSQKWGTIPLPDAKPDPSAKFSMASVNVRSIMTGSNPAENITIMPGDVITVPRADIVYAVGAVIKPGGFLVTESGSLSALQVISLAEGLDKTASPKKAMILRSVAGSDARSEIAVNLQQIIQGQGSDAILQANDILFVPTSAAKAASKKAIDAIVAAATGIAVYGRY